MTTVDLRSGDCLEVLKTLPDCSVDAIVTDPPYGLSNTKPAQVADVLKAWVTGDTEAVPTTKGGFMGKDWDSFVPPPAVWEECMRVLKPGGHMAVFAGARTQDLMGLSIRLAGFEIRDTLGWVYGSGFPKSMDVSKAIDKAAGAEREVIGSYMGASNIGKKSDGKWGYEPGHGSNPGADLSVAITAPATDEARQWSGWGTALKPAIEPIILARKPLVGTVAANVLAHGVGGLNIDACRVPGKPWKSHMATGLAETKYFSEGEAKVIEKSPHDAGRFPANVLLDEHAAQEMDKQSGVTAGAKPSRNVNYGAHKQNGVNDVYGAGLNSSTPNVAPYNDSGGASRFFPVFKYQAKAPKKERPVVERPPMLQLRDDLTPEQVDHVRARLQAVGLEIE